MNPSLFSKIHPLKIGTRGSDLALAQAHQVRDLLMDARGLEEDAIEIQVIKTTGDIVLDRPLSEIGGKGLFTKEIEQALLDETIDIAVHSSKDMPTILPEGLVLDVFLAREDTRDAFISENAGNLAGLAKGAVIGSASLRRQAQLKRYRSDFEVVIFRGNVQTRLRKLKEGQAAATLLAAAGLHRLSMHDVITDYLDPVAFMPACAQGAIGIELRQGDKNTKDFIKPLHHANTAAAINAERAFLKVLDGSCRTPIAGIATVDEGKLSFLGEVLSSDGSQSFGISGGGLVADAEAVGQEAGLRLKSKLGDDFLRSLHQR